MTEFCIYLWVILIKRHYLFEILIKYFSSFLIIPILLFALINFDKHDLNLPSVVNIVSNFLTYFMAPFYVWGSTVSRLEPLQESSLLFTTKFPNISGTHFIDLGRMKGWVNLGATQWFWTILKGCSTKEFEPERLKTISTSRKMFGNSVFLYWRMLFQTCNAVLSSKKNF